MDINKETVIIGGGPAGYVAAIRAAQLGGSVTLVEKDELGGTCLNRGCIPSKALLHSAELYDDAVNGRDCGVICADVSIDWQKVQRRRADIVSTLVGGIHGLMRANKIRVIQGTATFVGEKEISVNDQIIKADKIIIASGSVPVVPRIPGTEGSAACIDSTDCLELDHIPESLVVVGGGVIGVELGYAYASFGSKVTILEKMSGILLGMDGELTAMLSTQLKNKGIEIYTDCQVMAVEDSDGGAIVHARYAGKEMDIQVEKVLLCVGRKPEISQLGLESAGIVIENGHIKTSDDLQTNVPGVYAIGDCTGKSMLAHAAMVMGEIAADNAAGDNKKYDGAIVPSCCYVGPEFAGIGLTEEKALEQELDYRVGRFPTAANGRSLVAGHTDGMVKVIVGNTYGEILGVHILAPNAAELIEQAGLAMQMELTAEEFIHNITCHPSVSETLREAVMAAEKKAIHIINR